MQEKNRQAQRSESTKAKLIQVGRQLFAEQGYAAVSMEELMARSGVSKGGIYHHFEGKEGLFLAVYRQMQQEITTHLEAQIEQKASDAWSGLCIGCHAFLEACLRPEVQRIVLLDAPSVLSWETWRTVDAELGLGSLKQGLAEAARMGFIDPTLSLEAIAVMLEGAMNDAAMWIARSNNPALTLTQAQQVLDRLLESIRSAS